MLFCLSIMFMKGRAFVIEKTSKCFLHLEMLEVGL